VRRLLLVGAGGHGRVVADLAECLGFETIDFADEQWPEISRNGAWPVVGSIDDVAGLAGQYDAAIATSGKNAARLGIHRRLKDLAAAPPVLIHPSAVVSRHARLGSGSVVLANAVVNAFATIGEAAILNTACTVDHDCRLGDGVHVSPGAHLAGQVEVGDCAWIGIGASIRQRVRIGSETVVGAGSTVVSDIDAGATVFGSPARARAPKQIWR
jgi:sugar O-acyltransferase (sialic acid O-acetyltransferase NeuD family)